MLCSLSSGRRRAAFLLAAGTFGLLLNAPAFAQTPTKRAALKIAPDKFWKQADANKLLPDNKINPLTSRLVTYGAAQLDMNAILAALKQAPQEFTVDIRQSPLIITLPMPDGTTARFSVVESSILSPQIAAAHPEIKTYIGQGIDDPTATVRIDHTPDGFHAMILSPNGQVFIDPYTRGETSRYISYYKADMLAPVGGLNCGVPGDNALPPAIPNPLRPQPRLSNGTMLRTYRLATSCTAEFAGYFGGTATGAMNGIVTAINRVDSVYETEVAIRFVIVKFNLYTDIATEPFTDTSNSALIDQNQIVCDGPNTANTGPGDAGYDIGHVFALDGNGGLAALGVVGKSGQKGRGESGSNPPSGEGYYIDFIAHEFGHMFSATHIFNAGAECGANRTASSAYEPGSGTTIMAYAGVCGSEDVQPHNSPNFNTNSFDQIVSYSTTDEGDAVAVHTDTGNHPPTVNAGANYTIPQGTPFTLTATGSDPDGDAVTYSWEEHDLGAATVTPNNGSGVPLFSRLSAGKQPFPDFPEPTRPARGQPDPVGNPPNGGRNASFQRWDTR